MSSAGRKHVQKAKYVCRIKTQEMKGQWAISLNWKTFPSNKPASANLNVFLYKHIDKKSLSSPLLNGLILKQEAYGQHRSPVKTLEKKI